MYLSWFLVQIILVLIFILPLIISVAFFTLAERRLMAKVQRRQGPNVVGFGGALQPFSDAFKLIIKEFIFPSGVFGFFFFLAPLLALFLALCCWSVVPFSDQFAFSNMSLSLLFIFSISSLNVYSVFLAGWSSNSKYALLGSLRSVAQVVSYELSFGFILATVGVCAGSLNLFSIVFAQKLSCWFILPLLPAAFCFFIILLAETNRAPFDLPEAEAELVAGFSVEYSSMSFALFFLGEYCSILLMCSLFSLLFLGGWLPFFDISFLCWVPAEFFFASKSIFLCYLFIFVRANFPRYRYDQLMYLGWKVFLPLNFIFFVIISIVLFLFGGLPNDGSVWLAYGV